ncbi:MAG: tetratricopeptide repeat protein [Pseudomonadota bacterium]
MEILRQLTDWLAANESVLSAVAALTVIVGLAYGGIRFVLSKSVSTLKKDADAESGKPALTNFTGTDAVGERRYSLSVLLFQALSKNDEDEFLASGITSEVIAHVTMVPNIRVSSRLTSFGFKSGEANLEDVARQFNSRYILSGSLARAGDKIRVIAQLTDVEHDNEIWATTYDRELEDLFDVQQDIARCIVGAVLGEVRLAETLFAGAQPEPQLDAWGLAQKAYHFWLTKFTPEAILQACDYLRQALALEPEYASARAALAMLLAQQMTVRICPDYEACATEARDQIEKALEQAPNDIDVLENAGVVFQNLGEKERALRALRRVVERAPLNLTARGYLGLLLALTGSDKDAHEAIQILDDNMSTAPNHPSMPYWQNFMGFARERLGEHEAAIELAEKSLSGQPGWVHNYFLIANARCELGDVDGARKAVEQATAINPYLTPALFVDNVLRITRNDALAAPLVGGIRKHLQEEEHAQSA